MTTDGTIDLESLLSAKKRFYQATAGIMRDLEDKGYQNSADETIKVISAYHNIVNKQDKVNSYSQDYNAAFKKIDEAIEAVACKVYYKEYEKKYDKAYVSFSEFDHVDAILARHAIKKTD